MQNITTKFHGPTNTRGARITASCDAGRITMGTDHALDIDANHMRVARALIEQLGWFHDAKRGDRYGDWYCSSTKTGFVFVCAVEYAKLTKEVL